MSSEQADRQGVGQPPGFARVVFTDAAIEDLRAIKAQAAPVLRQVFIALKQLEGGHLQPTALNDYGKTGDLSDCGKIVIETPGYPEYRIVLRAAAGEFEVIEVICVEERVGDLAYLLAGVRLGRIADPDRRTDAQRRIARIRKQRGW